MPNIFTTIFAAAALLSGAAHASDAPLKLQKYATFTENSFHFDLNVKANGKATYVENDEGNPLTFNGSWTQSGNVVTFQLTGPKKKKMTLVYQVVPELQNPDTSVPKCKGPYGMKPISVDGKKDELMDYYVWSYASIKKNGMPCA